MTATLLQEGLLPDADLVAQSRRGNREAFGRIVRRYQGMVAGMIYSVCGDLHRSEDFAQETFRSAWKSLSGIGVMFFGPSRAMNPPFANSVSRTNRGGK